MKLSFVIPVYNVEPYLRKCVDSILAQHYDDYEIILVDDGSQDLCPTICDEYAGVHSNICVIHQQNAGLSAARNAGVAISQGEYLCFVDSDDYWQPNVLCDLMEQIERDDLDVLRFKYQNVRENGEVFNPYKTDPFAYDNYSFAPISGEQFLNERFGTACYAVMFIFRKALFTDCPFTSNIYFEDTDWTPRMLLRAKRVASADRIVYNYLVREGSITKAIDPVKQKKVLDDKMRLIVALKTMKTPNTHAWFERMISFTFVSIIGILATSAYSERRAYLHQLHQSEVLPLICVGTLLARCKILLINMSPRLAVEMLHLKISLFTK